MNEKLKTLILMVLKQTGSYTDALSCIKESLTIKEVSDVTLFFTYLAENGKKIGHGNIEAEWDAWKGQTKEKGLTRFAVDFTGTYYVEAKNEGDAKVAWENADFGEGERLEISEVRRVI